MSAARTLVFFSLALTACATTSTRGDLRSIETRFNLTLTPADSPDTVPEEVDTLLGHPLTPDDAVRVALLNNREARAALAELGIARGNYVQAGLLPNPEVEFEVRGPGGPQPLQMDIGLELNLSGFWLTALRSDVAEAQLEAAKTKAAGQLLDLAFDTRVTYFEAQAAQQRHELRLRALAAQQASYEAAQELSRVGNLPALRVANELAAVELARVQAAEAENAWLDAREALTRRLGLTGARTQWSLAGPMPLPDEFADTADAEKKAITASLELRELQHRAEAASRKVGLANTEGALPHVAVGFHGERDADLWELGAHLTVALPVFDRAQGRQFAARSEFDLLRARAEGRAIEVRSVVRATLNRAESASRRARHYAQRLVPAREEALAQTVLQYNAMQLGVFEVLTAQRAVTDTALMQVDATLDAWKARASLELLMAGRSTPLKLGALPSSLNTDIASGAH